LSLFPRNVLILTCILCFAYCLIFQSAVG